STQSRAGADMVVDLNGNGKLLMTRSMPMTEWLNPVGDEERHLWNLITGEKLRAFWGQAKEVRCVALSKDGKWLVTGNHSTPCLWEVSTGKKVRSFHGHHQEVNSLALSDDGKRLVAGALDQSVLLWEVPTGKIIRSFSAGKINCMALSGDSKWLVTYGYLLVG